jgi:hypothetical protein
VGAAATALVASALMVLAPVVVAAVISKYTGGDLQEVMAGKLNDLTVELAREVLQIETLTVLMAVTAAEAALLSDKDLLEMISKAVTGVSAAALAILLAELINRYPGCVAAVSTFKTATSAMNRAKNPNNQTLYGNTKRWLKIIADTHAAADQSFKDLQTCMRGHP